MALERLHSVAFTPPLGRAAQEDSKRWLFNFDASLVYLARITATERGRYNVTRAKLTLVCR